MKTKYTMKTKNRMNLGLLSFVACFTAAPAWAADYTVGPTENYTHHTITAAITAANAGDTITVYTGTYAGDLTLDEAITLTGSNVVVDGDVIFSAAVNMTGVTLPNAHHSHVLPGGSIQTALNAALVGGTVNVAAGTYAEALSITKALTLTGDSAVVDGNVTFSGAVSMTGVTVQNTHSCIVVPGGSIQTALNAALAGGTVTVATGTYVGNLTLGTALTLTGTSAVVDGNVSFGAAVTMTGVTVQNDHSCNVVSGGSIQTAVNAALAGGTVNVDHGTYVEELDITKNLTLTGTDGSGTTFINAPVTVSTHTRNLESPRILVAVESATVTISGFTIDGLKRAGEEEAYWGVNFWNSSGTLQNCTVKGFMHDTTDKSVTKYGVHVNQTTSGSMTQTVTISGNDVNTNGTGISLDATITTMTGITAHNNKFSGNIVYGIRNSKALDVDATSNYWGHASGPGGEGTGSGNAVSTYVTFSPWWTTAGFGTPDATDRTVAANTTITNVQTYDQFIVPIGKTVTVGPTGRLAANDLDLASGATLIVNGGVLALGEGSTISGTFTIFNNFGSWDINGDTTFEVNQSLSLITDIHIKAGKTVTVTGGGELILDGCVIDSQTPDTPYNITAATTGLLTIARCVVTDANIDINTTVEGNRKSRVYDNRFTTSDIEASAAAMVYHNLFDATTNTAKNTDVTVAFAAIDGWANVTDAAYLQNKFTLDFDASSETGRTLDASHNLFVQSGDAVVMTMDVAVLGENNITAAEALLGYNSTMLTLSGSTLKVSPETGWEVFEETQPTGRGAYGLVDSSLGMLLAGGNNTAGTIAHVDFTAGSTQGRTVGFFRVQTDGAFNPDGTLVKDTRLTGPQNTGYPLVSAFTANTGELVIDNQAPTILESSANATQEQVNTVLPVDVLDATPATPPGYVFRNEDGSTGNGKPVIMTFTATDAGDAGLDAPDATADLVLTASNDGGATSLAYTVTASGTTTVTYTVTFTVPVTATNGTYAVSATVRDRSGNVSVLANLGSFQIANEVLAAVQLEGFDATSRVVTFAATGGTLKTWTKTVTLTPGGSGATGSVPLEAVPAGTTAISAKTAWNLRSKLGVTFSTEGVGAVALTGTDKLPGGDLNGDNVANTRDYAVLRYYWGLATPEALTAADIDGSGEVATDDYDMLNFNFYAIGDPE
jgi:hypothetical protein